MVEKTDDNSKIAVIQTDISYIQKDIADIKAYIKELTSIFASKESLITIARETEVRFAKLENASNLWKWLSPTLAAVFGSVLTFLLIQYIMDFK